MASIDQRIVELKFDAKQFRSGIQAAISSLDNLKKKLKLDNAANEFDKVGKAAKNVKFTDMQSSLDMISSKFSTFGIIGTTALVNIANTAVNAGKRMLSALTEPLIAGGKRRALNIEQAKFQIEGLGYTWEQVEGDINYGVQDTAYGLDAAAKAASQLLASQVQVGDQMKASLRGISGVAAMTSSEYEDIANVFTTVAGNGRLMGDQLQQLSSRGLNAAATLGQYLGKSEGDIRQMVSKGQIDFNTFAAAMDNAFGEHAKKANDTFTGSLSNMKAALSRIGAEFATPAYKNLRDVFNSLTPAINGVKMALDPLIKSATQGMEIVKTFITSKLPGTSDEVKKRISTQLAPVMERLNLILRNLAQTVVNVLTTIKNVASPIINAFTTIFGVKLLDLIVGVTSALKEFTGLLNGGMGESRMMANLNMTFQGIFTILLDIIQVISTVAYYITKILWTAIVKTFGFFADIALVITGHLGDWVVSIRHFVDEILSLNIVQRIFGAIGGTFKGVGSIINWLYEGIRNLVVGITDGAFTAFGVVLKGILVVLKSLATGIDYVVMKIGEFIERVKQLPAVQQSITRFKNIFDRLKSAVKEFASSFSGNFTNALNKGINIVGKFVSKIKELIEQYVQLPTLEEVVTTVMDFMLDAIENGIDIFGKLKELLTDIFEKVKELTSVSLSKLIDNFNHLKDKIIEVIDASGKLEFLVNMFGHIKEGAKETAQATGSFLELAKEKIITFIEWIKTKFSQLTVGDVMAAGIGGTFIVFLVQLTKFTNTAESLLGSLNNLSNWLNGFGESIKKVVDNFAKLEKAKAAQMKMEAITDLIKSVVLLAGAVALLATMDQDKVRNSAIVIGVLAIGLVALTTAMNTISKDVSPDVIAKSALSMISAAGSLLVLTLALKLIGDMPIESIAKSLGTIAVMMLEFAALLALINKISPEFDKSSWSILALASAMLLLGKAISLIGEIKAENLVSSLIVMTTLMAVLGVMTKIAGKAKLDWQAAVGILGAVIGLRLLIGALKSLAEMDSATINKGMERLIILMGTMSMVFIASKYAGEHAAKAGIAVIAMSIAMHIMVAVIQNMASIKDSDLKAASKTVISILGIFSLITLTTKFAGKHAVGAGAAIMMMAGSMLLISAAMIVLSRLSEDEIDRATGAVVSVMAMFALIVAAMGQVREAKSTMTVIAVTIGVLAGSLAVLALIEPANLIGASVALSMVMAMFALIVASTGKIVKANGTLIMMVGVIAALAGVLYMLAQLPVENSIAAAASLSILLLSLVYSVTILQHFKPELMKNILAGLGAMGVVLAAVLGVLAILAAINQATNGEAEEFLRSGIPILQIIGQAIGEFVGGLLGGIAAGASAALVTLADNLSKFMTAMQPFFEMVRDVDDSAIDGVKKLVEMVLLFAVADFIEGINVFGSAGSSIRNLSETLPLLAETMKTFSESLDGIDLDGLVKGTEAAKNVADIANITREGGWLQGLLGSGNQGLRELSTNLPLFGEAIKAYGETVEGLNTDAINNSVEPAKQIIELGNLVNGEDGLLQAFAGSNASGFEKLSQNLPAFGEAIVAYGQCFSESGGMNWDDISRSADAAKALVEVANAVNAEGGTLQDLAGSTALGNTKFITNLVNLGKALGKYSKAVSEEGFDVEKIKSTIDPLKSLVEIANIIGAEGGVLQNIVGSTALGNEMFAKNLYLLGVALSSFSEAASGIDVEAVNTAIGVARSITEVVQNIEPTGGLLQGIYGSNQSGFREFNTNLIGLGTGIKSFAESVSGIPTDGLGPAVRAATSLVKISNSIATEGGFAGFMFGGHSEALSNFSSNVSKLGDGIRAFCEKVSGIDGSGVDVAVNAIRKLASVSNSLDASGGAAGFWMGDKADALRQFSTNIVTLGESISAFAQSVSGGNSSEALTTTANALNTFTAGSSNWSLSTDMLITVGNRLVQFGGSFAEFTARLGTVDLGSVILGVEALNKLGPALNSFPKSFDGSALTGFVNTLKGAATDAVGNFIQALDEGAVKAGASAANMVNFAMNQAISKLVSYHAIFRNHGRTLMLQIAYGMSDGSSSIAAQINTTIGNAVQKVRDHYGSMVSAGEYLCSGVSQGISNGYWWPINNVGAMGDDMVARLKSRLGIASPAKRGIEIGKFWNMGIAVGVVKFATMVFNAINDSADTMEDQMYDRFGSNNFGGNLQPIITPELDLSEVDKGLKQLDDRFALGAGIPINMQGVLLSSALTNMNRNNLRRMELQNGTPMVVNNNYDMTQNNYSPKALSRIDIYRDTRNQFSRLKGVVNK